MNRRGLGFAPALTHPTSRPLTVPQRIDGVFRRCNEGTLLSLFGWDPQTLLSMDWTYGTQRFFGEVDRNGMRKCAKKAEKVGPVSREDRPKVDTPGGALPPEP